VRFTNAEVTDELDSVLERIRAELKLPYPEAQGPLSPDPSLEA
jgi:very-short-patch-repair endonuclease